MISKVYSKGNQTVCLATKMSNRAHGWDNTDSGIRWTMRHLQKIYQKCKRVRGLKEGLGNDEGMGILRKTEKTVATKNADENKPFRSTALHSQKYLKTLICLERDLTMSENVCACEQCSKIQCTPWKHSISNRSHSRRDSKMHFPMGIIKVKCKN